MANQPLNYLSIVESQTICNVSNPLLVDTDPKPTNTEASPIGLPQLTRRATASELRRSFRERGAIRAFAFRLPAMTLWMGTAATLMAQSNVPSFEMYNPNYWTSAPSNVSVSGDFHNAGKQDVVYVGNTQSQKVLTMLTGNGDGTFQAPQTVASPTSFTDDLAAADINGDGNLDLVATTNSKLEVYYGNGNGTFQAGVVYATTAASSSVAVGNFFNDGYSDVAVGDQAGNVELFRNVDGKSLVLASTVNIASASGTTSTLVRAGNLNGNGLTSLGVLVQGEFSGQFPGTNSGIAYAVWNLGDGNFSSDKLASYQSPFSLNVGSANGSGIDDILLSYYCDPSVPLGTSQTAACTGIDIFYGQGNQTLIQRTAVTDPPDLAANSAPWAVDVNGDGIIDLVSAGYHKEIDGDSGLMVWLGNPDGTFQQTPQYYFSDTDNAGAIVPGDWARNGMVGFVMVAGGESEIWVNASNRAACGTYTISPSVTACQPVNNTYSPSPVTVQANGYDTTPITALQEYIDGTLKYSQPVTSFDTTFALGLGTHLLVTKGWDSSGRNFVADRTITVFNGSPYPVCAAAAGTANICLPSGTTSSSPVHILANGATDVIPSAAQLYIDGDLVVNNSGATSYVDTTQSLSSGMHDLVFKMWDVNGDVYQATKTVTVN